MILSVVSKDQKPVKMFSEHYLVDWLQQEIKYSPSSAQFFAEDILQMPVSESRRHASFIIKKVA